MKRCPECRRDYYDDSLHYCLDDGTALVEGPASGSDLDEPATAMLRESSVPLNVDSAQSQIHPTEHTAVSDSGLEDVKRSIFDSRFLLIFLISIAALSLVAGGIAVYRSYLRKAPPFRSIKIEKLTNIGNATASQISPNGEYVAHVLYENGKNSIRVWDVATRSSVEVLPPTEDNLVVVAFSPDSRYIYYRRSGSGQPPAVYQITVIGGTAKKLFERANSFGLILSADGKQFAFIVNGPGQGENSLMLVNADGTGERALATRKVGERFGTYEPAWSPDGRVLATGVYVDGTNMGLAAVSVEDGSVKTITSQKWPATFRATWLRDGSGLVFAAGETNRRSQIWYASYPAGEVSRITNDANNYGSGSVSLTTDSSTIATIQLEYVSNIFVAPANDIARAKQITRGVSGLASSYLVSWMPDGRLVYSGTTSGNPDIWIMNADGTGSRQLTNDPAYDGRALATPDGRYIVFDSSRQGRHNIWRMNTDGSNLKQLSNGEDDEAPRLSSDGRWVIYDSITTADLRKVPVDGGDEVRLTEMRVYSPAVSPKDGRIAGLYQADSNSPWNLAIFNAEGGSPVRIFDLPSASPREIVWAADGRAIWYVSTTGGASSLWSQSIDGGPPKQLADFNPEQIFDVAIASDGRLAFARGTIIRDVILITDTGSQ